MALADSPAASGPWLKNKDWAAREIRDSGAISTFYLVIAYLLFLSTVLGMLASNSPMTVSEALVAGAVVCVFTPGLTFFWLRHKKYGDSICRLITLPGVIGGWFKADVECKLPPNPGEPVTIQLINITGGGRYSSEKWRMEQTLASDPIPVAGTGRSIVRVRLRISQGCGAEADSA